MRRECVPCTTVVDAVADRTLVSCSGNMIEVRAWLRDDTVAVLLLTCVVSACSTFFGLAVVHGQNL
jgi:hypothetical protein